MASEQQLQSSDDILRQAESLLQSVINSSETGKTAAAASLESKKIIEAALVDVQARLVEITTASTQAVAAKTKIVDDQAVIATKSDHIEQAQAHADTVRANLDRALTSATQQVTKAEAEQSKAQVAAEAATVLLADIQTKKASADTDADTITELKESATIATTALGSLADKAAAVDTKIQDYEGQLGQLHLECKKQLQTIESLLPGAASAGLAHAWDERRKTFLGPQGRWQIVFVCSVLTIVGLAVWGLWHIYAAGKTPTYDELARIWLSRIPVAGALVWLALHASRESALAKRLEEDYGYKAAMASCFEGFRKQMSELGTTVTEGSPLAELCKNTLTAVATPPGRIYEKHALNISPADELTSAAKVILEAGATKAAQAKLLGAP